MPNPFGRYATLIKALPKCKNCGLPTGPTTSVVLCTGEPKVPDEMPEKIITTPGTGIYCRPTCLQEHLRTLSKLHGIDPDE